jgi:hypothetical protein
MDEEPSTIGEGTFYKAGLGGGVTDPSRPLVID